MPEFNFDVLVQAPVEAVFEEFTDFEHAAGRIKAIESIEMLTSGPVGVGTKFRETRTMFGQKAVEVMEVTEYSGPNGFTLSANSHGTQYHCTHRFVPAGDGTKVTMNFAARPQTFFARLMSPLAWLFMGTMRKAMTKDFEEMKAVCESLARV